MAALDKEGREVRDPLKQRHTLYAFDDQASLIELHCCGCSVEDREFGAVTEIYYGEAVEDVSALEVGVVEEAIDKMQKEHWEQVQSGGARDIPWINVEQQIRKARAEIRKANAAILRQEG